MTNKLLEGALDAARRGLRVHPLWPRIKDPILLAWPQHATRDEQTIRAWWKKYPLANIGVIGLILDIDTGISSLDDAEKWASRLGLPSTAAIRTGRRPDFGVQFHFTGHSDFRGAYKFLGCAGELRYGNMFGLWSPSIHPDSKEPYLLLRDLPFAEWPNISLGIAQKPETYPAITPAQAENTYRKLLADARTAVHPGRHDAMHKLTYFTARAVLAKLLSGTESSHKEIIFRAVEPRYAKNEAAKYRLASDIDRSWAHGASHGPFAADRIREHIRLLFQAVDEQKREQLACLLDGNYDWFGGRKDQARSYLETLMLCVDMTDDERKRVLRYARFEL